MYLHEVLFHFRLAFHIDLTEDMLQKASEKIRFVLKDMGLKK